MASLETPPDRRTMASARPGLEINTGRLKNDGMLLQEGAGGYVCLGLGDGAALLRFAFEDQGETPFFDRCRDATAALEDRDVATAERLGLWQPVSCRADPPLRRLAVADALLKAGFDPDQPRDGDGRWTDTGGSGGAAGIAGAAAGFLQSRPAALREAGSLLGRLAPAMLRALSAFVATVTAPVVAGSVSFLGFVLIPFNRRLITEGNLPDQPDVQYHFDRGTGVLELGRGGRQIFSGQADADGIFRTEDGQAIGRRLDGTIMVDPEALLEAEASRTRRKRPQATAGIGTATGADDASTGLDPEASTQTSRDDPQVCPKPVTDRPGSGNNFNGLVYQEYIHWLSNPDNPIPPGMAIRKWDPVTQRWVYYDDCRREIKSLVEGKSGYKFMLQPNRSGALLNIVDRWRDQARRQIRAARGWPIEWHFSEPEVADFARTWFSQEFPEITVYYTPLPKEWQQ